MHRQFLFFSCSRLQSIVGRLQYKKWLEAQYCEKLEKNVKYPILNMAVKKKDDNCGNITHHTGFYIRAGSRRNSPAIPHDLTAYLIEKLPHILRLT